MTHRHDPRTRPRVPAILAAGVVIAVTACGGGGTATTAQSLAQRIPGCGPVVVNTPPVMAKQDVTCLMPDGEQFEVVTFASSADEGQWIADGGYPSQPDPAYLGCCAEGNGWAAAVDATGPQGAYDLDPVVKALGGREVSG
jgi:hypothetical protein